MKTIAQQLNIKDFPFVIKDNNGKETYSEDSTGFWIKREFDSNGKQTYLEDSNGYWSKREYDKNGKETYHEDSYGLIKDNRSTELTLQEIADKFGMDVKNLKIKDLKI